MSKLLWSNLANKLIFAFPPLEIKPVFDGYRLTAEPQRQLALGLLRRSKGMEGVTGLGAVIVAVAFIFSPITFPLLSIIWPILIPVPIFLVAYGSLKLIFDPQFRFGIGTRFGLAPVEIIFSHYPLRVGEDDRLAFRRQLRANFWTRWFNIHQFPDQGRLSVSLICGERVTYTQGTDTITEVATIYEEQIYSRSLMGGDRQVIAYFTLHIPAHLPPAFEGKHNQIRWLLKIEENYPQVIAQQVTYFTFVVAP
ncbi:MAG: hypothetical protein RLZZ490_447 [Cyanobacteriota bacterium]|jgi:hypothetical protein